MHYGCDIGARRLAVACAETHHVAELVLPDPRRGKTEITGLVLRQMAWWVQQAVPKEATLWIEAPFSYRNIKTAMRLSMTAGAVMVGHQGPAFLIDNNVWKTVTVGDHHADKPAIRAWLEGTHPALAAACGASQDLTDAACISIGAAFLAQGG